MSISHIDEGRSWTEGLAERLQRAIDGRVQERSKKQIETNYRNRLERIAFFSDDGIKVIPPEVEGVDPEVVQQVLGVLQIDLNEKARDMLMQMADELMELEVEMWRLQNGEPD